MFCRQVSKIFTHCVKILPQPPPLTLRKCHETATGPFGSHLVPAGEYGSYQSKEDVCVLYS